MIERTPVAGCRMRASAASWTARAASSDLRPTADRCSRLDGFAPFPEESAVLLAAVPALERTWGARLERVERVGPSDVALHFAGTPLPVLADPTKPAGLAAARRVLTAWTATRPAPVRLDARVSGLVAVLPAPPDPEEAK